MLIDNVVSLTFGALQNTPKVRDCYDISFNSADVRRGDLFIVSKSCDIEEAIRNGAYALLFDENLNISDEEIAWIKVDNLHDALTRIIRHELLERSLHCYALDRISVDMAKTLSCDENFTVVNTESLEVIYKSISTLRGNTTLLIDEALMNSSIFSTCKLFKPHTKLPVTLLEHTLFECSFLIDNSYYDKQRISPLLLPYLQKVFEFFTCKNIDYNMSKITQVEHFIPLFLNKSLVIKEYGSSERVIILESDEALFNEAVSFLKSYATWASLLIITPNNFNIEEYENIEYRIFEKTPDIIIFLEKYYANFTLILHDSSLKDFFNEVKPIQQLSFEL
jgi:ferrochelatase